MMFWLKSKVIASFALVLICLLGVSGCSPADKGELIYTTAEDVMVRFENEETLVVYLGTSTCSFCIKYKAELEKMVKKTEVTVYGVMINEGNMQNNQSLMDRVKLSGTPETFWIVDGEIVDSLVGYMPYRDVVDWLKKNEVIQ